MVLLENVSDIVHMGLQVIVDSLCGRLGYELRWMVLGAGELGAPHLRRRWFCMACRSDATAQALRDRVLQQQSNLFDAAADYPWSRREVPPLMTIALEPSRRVRCAALGNAVVPDCVRHAFWTLLSMHNANLGPWKPQGQRRWPMHGSCLRRDDGTYEVSRWKRLQHLDSPSGDDGLIFDPAVFCSDKPRSKLQRMDAVPGPVTARRWTTPRHGNVTAANVLTPRTLRDLPTQVRFERGTATELRNGQISPEFVEWMMGYPIGWTLLGTTG